MTVPLPFTKMHGLGNHYVFVEALTRTVDEPAVLARAVSDPSTGVGADGLILILPASPAGARAEGSGPDAGADVRMRIFNAASYLRLRTARMPHRVSGRLLGG